MSNNEEMKGYITKGIGIGIGIAVLLILYFLIDASLSIEDAYIDPTGFEIEKTREALDIPIYAIVLIILAAILIPFLLFLVAAYGNYWWEARIAGVHISIKQLIVMHFRGVSRKKIVKLLIHAKSLDINIEANVTVEALVGAELAEVDQDLLIKLIKTSKSTEFEMSFSELEDAFHRGVDLQQIMNALVTARSGGEEDIMFGELVEYSLANVDVQKLISAFLTAKNGNLDVSIDELKKHYQVNGDIIKTVDGVIAVQKSKLDDTTFDVIAAIDLAGFDIAETIRNAVETQTRETNGVMGHCKDGMQLTMKVQITVRSVLENFLGGTGVDTIVARVNEELVSKIGEAEKYTDILESPGRLADEVQNDKDGKIAENSAFEVLSIDVSNIEVGRNINEALQIERAKTDAANARTDMIRADEKVKKAMAAAFIDGTLSPREYYNMMNTQADTAMRKSMSGKPHEDPKQH